MSSFAKGARSEVVFYVNDDQHAVTGLDVFLPLSTYLRENKRMTGTKVVCEEGDCGACTVLLGWPDATGSLQYQIVNSCIQFVFQLDDCHIITVEGLRRSEKLHRVQEAMIEHFGSQCGFCTPGFVVAMADLAEKQESFDHETIKQKLTGNLCRCTGYEPILDACMSLNEDRGAKITEQFDNVELTEQLRKLGEKNVFIQTHGGTKTLFRPKSLADALAYKTEHPESRIVGGATDVGVQINKGRSDPDSMMFIAHLHEIAGIQETPEAWVVGAAANWSQVQASLGGDFPELDKILNVFASEQIKNAATIGGNIANASPIADSLPFLFVMDAVLVIRSAEGERRVRVNDFYKGYKTLDLAPEEMITAVEIPRPRPGAGEILRLYKVSKRKDLDISIFTAAVRLFMEGNRIEGARVAYGGVGPVVLRLGETEAFLAGKELSEETMAAAGDIAREEITPISDVRASDDYRLLLARNILLKFYHETAAPREAAG